ncbi:MAG: glycerol-3-phosphate 1-O-acyltransferase PlsY [Clostridia bacterium]|nr:glycerol-3-phosphate 1-O-acyltransferase PlsY [Clostridia bacterium]
MKIFLAVLAALMGYLLGSINASIIISKSRGKDIREMGSGNAGTTNTLRSLGKGAAAVTLIVDILKGVISVLLARLIFKDVPYADVCAGAGAVLGHNFPLYYGFRGGKGVLTSFAVALVLQPIPALLALLIGVVVIALTKYVSLGSILGAVSLPIICFFYNRENSAILIFMTCLAVLVIIRHHANIKRLIEGNERKLSFSKKEG